MNKYLVLFVCALTLLNVSTFYAVLGTQGFTLRICNDTNALVTISHIKSMPGYTKEQFLDNGTCITPGETLTVGTNIKEFVLDDGKTAYKVVLPYSSSKETLTLSVSALKLFVIGIKVQSLT